MGELLPRAHLLSTGWTSDAITAAARTGELIRIARGVYCRPSEESDWDRYRSRVLAVASNWDAVVSHESAAVLHDIPFLRPVRSAVHLTVNRSGGGLLRDGVHLHPRPLRSDEVTVVAGCRVTTRARTAIDVAMTGDLERAVCAVDAVRRVPRRPRPSDPKPVPASALADTIARLGRRRGAPVARNALDLSVTCSESPGESWSRMQILAAGLPAPRLQVEYVLEGQRFFSDFDWGAVTGEFDGIGKYGAEPVEVEAAIREEKHRHELFAASGIEVVRWSWRALQRPGRLRELLVPAFIRNGIALRA